MYGVQARIDGDKLMVDDAHAKQNVIRLVEALTKHDPNGGYTAGYGLR